MAPSRGEPGSDPTTDPSPSRDKGEAGACLLAMLLALVLAAVPVLAEPKFPQLTDRIVDLSDLLKPEDRAAIETELKALEEKSTDQLVVFTTPSLQGYAIEDFGYQLGRTWGIGQKGKDNGVILIVAPNERKVRIEVGRGLEPLLTDALTKLVIENAILPAFRRGDFAGGIRAGVRDIKDVLLGDAEAVKDRAKGGRPAQGLDWMGIALIAFWITIVIFVIWAHMRHARQMPQPVGRPQRRYRDTGPIVIPGGSGHWGGGWGEGGSGGWSGGGGDFGGGGSSGSW